MIRYLVVAIILLYSIVNTVYSQPYSGIIDNEYYYVTTIDKEKGTISTARSLLTDYIIDMNESGSLILCNGKIYKSFFDDSDALDVDLPEFDLPQYTRNFKPTNPSFIDNTTILAWINMASMPFVFSLYYYDFVESEIKQSFTTANDSFIHYQISGDTIIGYTSYIPFVGTKLIQFTIHDDKFEETLIYECSGIYDIILSKTGKRVFARVQKENGGDVEWIYIDKADSGWTESTDLPLPKLKVNDIELNFNIQNIANEGKTIVLTSDNFSSSQAGNCYLALINEKEGVWGEPELVSPFYFHIYDYWNGRHQFPSDYIIHNSDDSRVLAVQYTKEYSYEYGTVAWNSVVFIRNTEDKWITQRVNPSNIDVVYEMKLSGDGCKLVWFPNRKSSVPCYTEYQ